MSDNGASHTRGGIDSDGSAQSSESSYDPTSALMNEIDATQSSASEKPISAAPDLSTDQSNKWRAKEESDTRRATETGAVAFHDGSKQLPAEIWHHIFTFLPPRSLGNLLLVNKLFYNYLDPSPLVKVSYPCFPEPPRMSRKRLSICKPDSIWKRSRRLFWPRMPSPLKGRSEVDMWRLACSRSCHFCNITDGASDKTPLANDQWHRGPGLKGVSPIFPFFVASCGSCLASKSLKVRKTTPFADGKLMILQEIDVLLSPTTPSALLPGLPAGFLTTEMHVVAPQTMQGERSPIQGQLSKIYWKTQVDDIKAEFEEVKGLGSAAAEEWLKGLEVRGKLAVADASRWEKWDILGGVRQMRLPDTRVQAGSRSSSPNRRGHGQRVNQIRMEWEQRPLSESTPLPDKPSLETKNTLVGPHAPTQGHQKRTAEEVVELKQRRKAEIERRAGFLDPPLTPAVLAHIPSFQAALHIIAPLDDNAWELLRPRLLAQRAKAEKRERESLATAMTSGDTTTTTNGLGQTAALSRDPRQVPDEEWDEIQGPVRARISSYADEIITDGWRGGSKVTKKACPQFAAEVLVYVRKRFYAEVAKDADAAAAAGKDPVLDPPEGPWTQKLTLENMKWVFDSKVKPHTEKYRKELFFCNGCQANYKYYGFEGVIQHYAAKHTSALSLGNVVVYWRAEWPSTPPFKPDPKPPTIQPPRDHPTQLPPPATATQTLCPATTSGFHPSPATHQTVHFPETHTPFRYAASAPYPPSAAACGLGAAHPAPYPTPYTHQPYSAQAPYPPHTEGSSYRSSYLPPTPTSGVFAAHQPPPFHRPYSDLNGPAVSLAASGGLYKSRLDFMANVARQTWNSMSHVDGLPGAVKLCATIHHIAKGFEMHFSESAPLEMFIRGLSNHKEMRPARNINGLQCKPCVEGHASQNKPFSVPQLVNHFYKAHVESQAHPLDWRTQMILLPDIRVLEELPAVLAHNRAAYDTVADALPWAFVENRDTGVRGFPENGPLERVPGPSPASYEPRDSYSPIQLPREDSYSPVYVPPQPHEEHEHGSHQLRPTPAAPREQVLGQLPYYARDRNSDRPNLRPASEVYSRIDPPRLPTKREYDDSGLHAGSERQRPNKAPRVVMEERPKDVPDLSVRRPPPSTDEMSRQRDHASSSYVRNSYGVPSTDRWEANTHHMDTQIPVARPAENGFELLDGLSHLDGSQVRAGQPQATHPGIRPGEYHPKDPARYAQGPEWAHPQGSSQLRYPSHQDNSYLDRRPAERHYPPGQMEPDYRYRDDPQPRPMEEYELLEVRDSQQGTYYIRRPIRREFYTYRVPGDGRTQEHTSFSDYGQSRTGVLQPGTDLQEYDPRFPAGDVPPPQPRYR